MSEMGELEMEYGRVRRGARRPEPESPEVETAKRGEAFRASVARQRDAYERIARVVRDSRPETTDDGTETRSRLVPTGVRIPERRETPGAELLIECFTSVSPPPQGGRIKGLACGIRYWFQEEGSGDLFPGRSFTTDDIALHEGIIEHQPDLTQARIYAGYFVHGENGYALVQIEKALECAGEAARLPLHGVEVEPVVLAEAG